MNVIELKSLNFKPKKHGNNLKSFENYQLPYSLVNDEFAPFRNALCLLKHLKLKNYIKYIIKYILAFF